MGNCWGGGFALPEAGGDLDSRWIGLPQRFRRMTSTEIFQALGRELSVQVVTELCEQDKGVFRTALGALAKQRKMRPQYFERKSKAERCQWMAAELARKQSRDLALEVLQTWILRCHTRMVLDFLERLGIAHDGQGLIQELPPEPEPEVLRAAVEDLVARYPRHAVAVYLELFAQMEEPGWPGLRKLLKEREELRVAAAVGAGGAAAGTGSGDGEAGGGEAAGAGTGEAGAGGAGTVEAGGGENGGGEARGEKDGGGDESWGTGGGGAGGVAGGAGGKWETGANSAPLW